MSITFVKKQNNILEKIEDIIYNTKIEDINMQVSNYLMKIFDNHYLNYISNRKQRDLIILNCFYKIILENAVKCDKNIKDKYELSDFFEVKNSHIEISNNLLPISLDENVLHLEKEIEILKTLEFAFSNIAEKHQDLKQYLSIDKKMKKIKDLSDNKFINRITNSNKVKLEILEKIENIKDFNKISVNYNYYNVLIKEIELYGIKM